LTDVGLLQDSTLVAVAPVPLQSIRHCQPVSVESFLRSGTRPRAWTAGPSESSAGWTVGCWQHSFAARAELDWYGTCGADVESVTLQQLHDQLPSMRRYMGCWVRYVAGSSTTTYPSSQMSVSAAARSGPVERLFAVYTSSLDVAIPNICPVQCYFPKQAAPTMRRLAGQLVRCLAVVCTTCNVHFGSSNN
jgi:hypothetical protein